MTNTDEVVTKVRNHRGWYALNVFTTHRGIMITGQQLLDDACAEAVMPDGKKMFASCELYDGVPIKDCIDDAIAQLKAEIDEEIENHPQEYCRSCMKYHSRDGNHKCPKCGACHYKFGIHIPDEMYPLSKCGKCGEGHLWD